MSAGMALSALWPAMRGAMHEDSGQLRVRSLCMHGAESMPGALFFAVPGASGDGRQHLAAALRGGAAAIFAERHGLERFALPVTDVPIVAIPGLRPRISAMAAQFFGDPSESLWTVGVTGTKGKTSCVWLLAEAFRRLGWACGSIGTLGARCGDGPPRLLAQTTPDPIAVQRLLAGQRRDGAKAAALEVSSHALAQSRVSAVRFDVAVFTNLHAEHLDYHRSEAAYLYAKCRLFRAPGLRYAVFNLDDPCAVAVAVGAGAAERIGVSLRSRRAACHASRIRHRRWGTSTTVETPWGRGELELPVPGEFYIANALCALCALCAAGWPLNKALAALAAAPPPPGRMQAVHRDGDDIAVVVDYAHTAESLRSALAALRGEESAGRLWCVFGAGGGRYAGKRPAMGQSAARGADVVVLSSDNPRHEPPARIVDEIMAGVDADADIDVRVELDRGKAIAMAVAEARSGDTVLIAGKGHETHQQLGWRSEPFSDARCAAAALRRRRVAPPR